MGNQMIDTHDDASLVVPAVVEARAPCVPRRAVASPGALHPQTRRRGRRDVGAVTLTACHDHASFHAGRSSVHCDRATSRSATMQHVRALDADQRGPDGRWAHGRYHSRRCGRPGSVVPPAGVHQSDGPVRGWRTRRIHHPEHDRSMRNAVCHSPRSPFSRTRQPS